MPKELPLYQEYTDFVKRCLLMCGLYPYQQSVASKYLLIFWILGYCLESCALINFARLHITEISAITACLSVLSSIVNMTIKASRFVICKEKLVQVTDTLEALFEETSMQQPSSSPAFQFMLSFYRLGYYHYVCMYLLEVSICYSFWIITSGVDAFFTLCAFRMSSVFRAMAVELEEFPKRQNNGESNEQVLRRCIDRHVTLIKCRDTIQEIYGPIIFTIMMTNCLGMCALIFDVSKASAAIAVEKAVAITLYLTGKVLQTFTYTWPGDVVTNECDIFRQEVYCNNWYEDLNTKTGKLTLTILMQKPVILRACKLMTVTVDLFAKIMNRTISYYFLLVTLVDAE
ncbi:odorant receptor 4-like isoform X3 [Lasioglossum baleicum]|uniref:odorant receptor 4-like isoform X3 n=1 Tax=Lasioglossum baleicum TaxID=434251 RepID=UPI003FCC7800